MRMVGVAFALLIVTAPLARAEDTALAELLRRADAAYAEGDYEAAAAHLDRAIAEHPRDIEPAAYAKRASIFVLTGRHVDGLAWVQDVAERAYPDEPIIQAQQALLLWNLSDRRTDAALLAERVVRERPAEYPLQLLLGDYHLHTSGDADRAASAYRAYLQLRPERVAERDKRIVTKLGFALVLAGEPGPARRRFRVALSTSGDERLDLLARRGLCAADAELGRWRAAIVSCRRSLNEAGADAATLRHLARAHMGAGDLDRAVKAAVRHVRRAPRAPAAYVLLGDVLCAARAWERAESQYRRALLLDARDRDALHRLGRVALERRPPDPEEAVRRFERARRVHPTDSQIVYDLGRAHLSADAPDAAIAAAGRGLELEPDHARRRAHFLVLRGEARLAAGEPEPAATSFEAALELRAERRPAARAASGLTRALGGLAAQAVSRDQLDRAEELLRRGLRRAPGRVALARDLGIVLLEKGDGGAAVAVLEQAVAAAADDALAQRLLARAHAAAGDDERAADRYDTALERARAAGAEPERIAEILAERGVLAIRRHELDRAVADLEAALDVDVATAAVSELARRGLARARCRRGIQHLERGAAEDALADLTRIGDALENEEARACRFASGLARLEAGDEDAAEGVGAGISAGARAGWLAGAWSDRGRAVLRAYAGYRGGDAGAMARASRELATVGRGGGPLADLARALSTALQERLAFEHARAGRRRAARAATSRALRGAAGDRERALRHNRIALQMRAARAPGAFRDELKALDGSPPEALVNLGVLADRAGNDDKAAALWARALELGTELRIVREWLGRKKEILGL